MGNLCSIVMRGIEYLLRFILPRYTAMMLEGYNPVSEEHNRPAISDSVCSTPPQIGDSFTSPEHERYYTVEEFEQNEDQIPPGEDNTEYIRSIVNNFFTIHNIYKHALTKNITEKFFDLNGEVSNVSSVNNGTKHASEKEIKDCSKTEGGQIQHTISKDSSGSEQSSKETTANPNDKTRASNASLNTENKENGLYSANKMDCVSIDDCGRNKSLTESDKTTMNCSENSEHHQRIFGAVPPRKIQDQKEILENLASASKEISSSDRSKDGCKTGMVPSIEITQDREELSKNSQNCSKDVSPKDYSDDEQHAQDVEVGKERKLRLRKISLTMLYSGSHYAVVNHDVNIELSDYSKEFPPLRVDSGICYRIFTHPLMLSGGTVVFQEFSDYLSIPNWYEENPIVCDEIPEGIKAPQSSPVKLLQVEPVTFSRSSSGGSIVSDATSQKVYLPDLFSGLSSPLSRTYSPLVNTQSSTSFGELQTLTDVTTEIFTDLLNKSIAHDSQLAQR